LKTPITYYGGKQALLKHLLPLIPSHKIYCEPFFGGGALFFAKNPSEVEIINDINSEVVNFFKVVQTKFDALQKEVRSSLHSRELYKKAMVVYNNPDMFDDVKRAWAFWVATNQGFSSRIGSWGFGREDSKEAAIAQKRDAFTREYADRLKKVQVEHNDALKVIERSDSDETFFYIDPPYINSDQGHYSGYTETDYNLLLDKLSKVKGKFLLSSYPSTLLNKYIRKHKWKAQKVNKVIAVTMLTDKRKTEFMVMNYDPKKIVQLPNIKEIEQNLRRLKITNK
jgi:DNA adenine methylase